MDAGCANQSVPNGPRVGSPVRNHDDAVDPKERSTAVFRVIHVSSEGADGLGNSRAARSSFECCEQPFETIAHHFVQTLGRLQHDIAYEPIADDDVGASVEDVVTFNVSDKV